MMQGDGHAGSVCGRGAGERRALRSQRRSALHGRAGVRARDRLRGAHLCPVSTIHYPVSTVHYPVSTFHVSLSTTRNQKSETSKARLGPGTQRPCQHCEPENGEPVLSSTPIGTSWTGGGTSTSLRTRCAPRNQKPEIRNPKLETQNLEPEPRNPKPENRNPKPETRNPNPEIRNPKPKPLNPNP